MYRTLNAEKTLDTLHSLQKRILERFPDSGLSRVCQELINTAQASWERAEWISRPHRLLRWSMGIVIFLVVAILFASIFRMDLTLGDVSIAELIQITEAALNDLVLIGAAIFFLSSLELRIKRSRALAALHELRSLAHVIDMHQLTKDPSRLLHPQVILTASSPVQKMTSFELSRYLDYCSEMLSLTGKIAALYAQVLTDPVVLGAVNEIESLTTSLSRKIWQKIMMLDSQRRAGEASDPASVSILN